jgi:aldehyde dehydrogenase (NAD+)
VFALQQQHQWVVARDSAAKRIAKLRRLHDCLLRRRSDVEKAMWNDFRKNATEVNISELGVVLHEIRYAIRHVQSWMHAKKVGTPLTLFGASSEIVYEPKGVCLILAPWNFPFNLTFAPLVSAIAAGNCVILKPSELAPHSSALMREIVAECFPPGEVSLFEGDATVAQELLSLPFNHIFFTGSPQIGKIVMRAAAEHLASVTLELGGKSPVVVDDPAELDNAATKITWLKLLNASQTCIAPDYVLVKETLHDALIEKIKTNIKKFYGPSAADIQKSPDYCRLVHPRHFARVKALLDDALLRGATPAAGGETDEKDLFIAPTLLTGVPDEARIWEEEIFGPLLPVRTYQSLDQAIAYINGKPKALAMYIFTRDNAIAQRIIDQTRCGGVAINDCGIQFYNSEMPFGGSNNSGIGHCHGEFGFLEFSHQRSVMRQTRFFPTTDFFLPPYGGKLRAWLLEAVVRWL